MCFVCKVEKSLYFYPAQQGFKSSCVLVLVLVLVLVVVLVLVLVLVVVVVVLVCKTCWNFPVSFVIFRFWLLFSYAGVCPWNLHHEMSTCMHNCMQLFMHAWICSEISDLIVTFGFLLQLSDAGICPWSLHHDMSSCMHTCMLLFMRACNCY